MKKDFLKKLGEQIQKNGKTSVNENNEKVIEIPTPKLLLSFIESMNKEDLKKINKSKLKPYKGSLKALKFGKSTNFHITPPVK